MPTPLTPYREPAPAPHLLSPAGLPDDWHVLGPACPDAPTFTSKAEAEAFAARLNVAYNAGRAAKAAEINRALDR